MNLDDEVESVIVCCVLLTHYYSGLNRWCWMDSNLEFPSGNVINRCSLIYNHYHLLSNDSNSIVALVSWRG
jgi:hypothetical protein